MRIKLIKVKSIKKNREVLSLILNRKTDINLIISRIFN